MDQSPVQATAGISSCAWIVSAGRADLLVAVPAVDLEYENFKPNGRNTNPAISDAGRGFRSFDFHVPDSHDPLFGCVPNDEQPDPCP